MNWFIPALVKSSVGSSCGTSDELATMRWPFALKYSRNERRSSFEVMTFDFTWAGHGGGARGGDRRPACAGLRQGEYYCAARWSVPVNFTEPTFLPQFTVPSVAPSAAVLKLDARTSEVVTTQLLVLRIVRVLHLLHHRLARLAHLLGAGGVFRVDLLELGHRLGVHPALGHGLRELGHALGHGRAFRILSPDGFGQTRREARRVARLRLQRESARARLERLGLTRLQEVEREGEFPGR